VRAEGMEDKRGKLSLAIFHLSLYQCPVSGVECLKYLQSRGSPLVSKHAGSTFRILNFAGQNN